MAFLPIGMVEVHCGVFNSDDSVASRALFDVPRSAIRPQASGLGVLEWKGDEYQVVHYGDPALSGGDEWYEVERVLPAPEVAQQPEMIEIEFVTHYSDNWSDERTMQLPATCLYLRSGDMRVKVAGHEYTVQNIYEVNDPYEAWRDGGATCPRDDADERGADGSGVDERTGW